MTLDQAMRACHTGGMGINIFTPTRDANNPATCGECSGTPGADGGNGGNGGNGGDGGNGTSSTTGTGGNPSNNLNNNVININQDFTGLLQQLQHAGMCGEPPPPPPCISVPLPPMPCLPPPPPPMPCYNQPQYGSWGMPCQPNDQSCVIAACSYMQSPPPMPPPPPPMHRHSFDDVDFNMGRNLFANLMTSTPFRSALSRR
jgi:hypothetical protein